MLYMSELNKKNCYLCKQIFDVHNEYNLNLYCGDSLIMNPLEIWGVEKFDIIMGNPPYNKDNTGTGNSVWQIFVEKAFKIVKRCGYISMIHPAGWRKPSTSNCKFRNLYRLMTLENQMLYLSIYGLKDSRIFFNFGTRVDCYLIENRVCYKETLIKDEKKKEHYIKLNNSCFTKWLPNSNYEEVTKIISTENDNNLQIVCDFQYSRLKKDITSFISDDKFKYQIVYLTPKKGVRYMYSKYNDRGHFGISKVIIGESGLECAINDYNGKYGMTQDSFGIIIESCKVGEQILEAIMSNKFKDILKSCSWSNFRIDYRLFTYFKKDFWKEFITTA